MKRSYEAYTKETEYEPLSYEEIREHLLPYIEQKEYQLFLARGGKPRKKRSSKLVRKLRKAKNFLAQFNLGFYFGREAMARMDPELLSQYNLGYYYGREAIEYIACPGSRVTGY